MALFSRAPRSQEALLEARAMLMQNRLADSEECTPIPSRSMLREASAVALLVALVEVVFAFGWQRTSSERWQLPTRYSGDDVHSLALLKAARDGHLVPIVPLRVPELARSEDDHFIFVPLRAGPRRTSPPASEPRS